MDEAVREMTPGTILAILLLVIILIALGFWIVPGILKLLN